MPPYQSGTDRQPPPVPQRHTVDAAARPASRAGLQAPQQPEPLAPPPLPQQRQPHLQSELPPPRRPQPWPIQPAEQDLRATSRPDAADDGIDDVPANPARTANPKPQRRYSAIAYLLAGFVAGAVFWHAVGFWTLVHDLVFSGPRMTASDGTPLPVVTATPAPRQPPAATFDEETLRDHATRPTLAGAPREPSSITTGSIGSPAPAEVRRLERQATPDSKRPRKAARRTSEEPPVMLGPGGISWTPAVSRAR